MARLPRLAVAGQAHLLIQRGNNGQPLVADDEDRRLCLQLLREAAQAHAVAIHAYVLLDNELQLLATPQASDGLSRMMQALGRRYVGAFNRRHGRSGTLWEGRFRAAVIESERYFIACMRFIESQPVRAGLVPHAADWAWSSAAHHLGRRHDPLVADHPLFWALGNTPFDREMAYGRWLEHGTSAAEADVLLRSASKGWALGSEAFLARLAELTPRPLQPRRRGRPRKSPAST